MGLILRNSDFDCLRSQSNKHKSLPASVKRTLDSDSPLHLFPPFPLFPRRASPVSMKRAMPAIFRKADSMCMQTILVVDDDSEIREGIRILLSGEDYMILEADSGQRALEMLTDTVDLVILDVMMPGLSGLRTCEEIRKRSTVPVLFLTAKAQESDKLIGLTAGGDDYLAKPFSYSELIARVKALLRRYCVYRGKTQSGELSSDNILSSNGIRISLDFNQVWVRGKETELTDIEYKILRLLMQNPKRVFSIQSIYEFIWDEPYFHISNGTVMVHIRKLRLKIEKDPQNPKLLKTVWGKGYRFEVKADDA